MPAQGQNMTAINDYLIDKYDINQRLTYKSEPKKYQIQQWLHFQSFGQGPYFKQAA
jgi:glutathione S-transferase